MSPQKRTRQSGVTREAENPPSRLVPRRVVSPSIPASPSMRNTHRFHGSSTSSRATTPRATAASSRSIGLMTTNPRYPASSANMASPSPMVWTIPSSVSRSVFVGSAR